MNHHDALAKVLIVEDDADWLDIYATNLSDSSYTIATARTVKQASNKIRDTEFDVVATDLRLLGDNLGGISILNYIKSTQPDIQVIIFTGVGAADDAKQALQRGAYDYLPKPLDYLHARSTIRAAIEVRRELLKYRGTRNLVFPDRFLYTSSPMREVVSLASQLADQDNHFFIVGPRGSGKGLLAEAIHLGSRRKNGPFSLVNCTSLAERTLERTLFGYQGDTGEWHSGLLESLSGGSLVLDSVSGLTDHLQSLFLQYLLNWSAVEQPVAENAPLGVRIICIDQADLLENTRIGLFSPELFGNLNGALIEVPPLRQRRDERYNDIIHLAQYFITKYSTTSKMPELTDEVINRLMDYSFPENVRELQLIIRRAVAQAKDGKVMLEHLPTPVRMYGIESGLRIDDTQLDEILCPHGNFLCNQVKPIAEGYLSGSRVYVRLAPATIPGFAERIYLIISQQGFAVQSTVPKEGKLTPHCHYCMAIQMCRYAILDLVSGDPTLVYEIGLMHSLGVKTLLLKASDAQVSEIPAGLNIVEYNSVEQVGSQVEKWLQGKNLT